MSSFARTIRRRRPRFNMDELKALVSAVEKVKPMLFGARASPITVCNIEAREKAWLEICKAVNAVSQIQRGIPEIKKKWSDWSLAVRKKYLETQTNAEHQGAVTISSKFITPTERRLLAILEAKNRQRSFKLDEEAQVKQEAANTSFDDIIIEDPTFSDNDQDCSVTFSVGEANEDAPENVSQKQMGSESQASGDISASTDATQSFNQNNNTNSNNSHFIDESQTMTQNGPSSTGSVKQTRIVKHSDVLLALKRKKLRVMEEQVKIDKERLQVERGILQILKELKAKKNDEDSLI